MYSCMYLLSANVNGSFARNHFLQALDVLAGWVPFAPVEPTRDDSRGRRKARWTLHEQPPHVVTGEGRLRFVYSRLNPLAYFTLELSL